MTPTRLLAFVLLALLASLAHGADESTVSVPDPVVLPSDWWTYFEAKEPIDDETLQKRVETAKKFYSQLRQRLLSEGDTLDAQQIEKILGNIDRFVELKNAPAPAPSPTAAPQDSYTLDEALKRFDEWLVLKQHVDAESEESAWLATVLGERRKQQSRLRSQYLELDDQSSDRLARGLERIRKRLSLESQRLELDRRKILLKHAREKLDRQRAELDDMPGRLVATPKEIQRWEREYSEAQNTLDKLRNEIDQGKPVEARSSSSSQDLSAPQYTALVAVRKDIDIHIHELKALRAQNALSLIHLVIGESTSDSKAVRAQIDAFEALDETVSEQRKRWQRVIERVRSMLSGSDSGASQAAERKLYANIQQELEKTDQLLRRLQRENATGEFVVQMLSARLRASEGWMDRNLTDFSDRFMKAGATTINLLGATMFEINETPVTALGLLRVVLILTAALWLSRIIRRAIQHVGERRGGLNQSSLYTFGRLVHYLVLTIGIIIGLSSIGIDFTKFALFASALGVGIGFGLQTLISNFVAGLIILFEKSLKVGDFVELESGVTGEVKEINMRSTLMTTNDNIDILVPNSEFVGGRVTNWTLREAYRRVRVPFGVAYGTDKEVVKKAVLEAADKVPWTLTKIKNRHPQVWFVAFGDSSLNFELVVWLTPEAVKRPGSVTAAYLWEIDTKLNEYGIEIPFPQRDLHLRSVFGLKDDAARSVFARPTSVDPQCHG